LVPFSLPVVGGETFHHAFNLTVASRRVYLSGDPVTQTARLYQVGRPYEIIPESPMYVGKRGLRISTLRHEPYLIREYLIKDLQRTGFPPPAGFPVQKPWKTFENFKGVLLELQNTPDQVSQILGRNFNARLVQYLDVLRATVNNDNEQYRRLEGLRLAIRYIDTDPNYRLWDKVSVTQGNLTTRKTLNEVYTDSKGIFGSDFDKFLGLCLFLSVASKATFTQASTRVFKPTGIVPFMKLPLQ
jgi:hypothetical protein